MELCRRPQSWNGQPSGSLPVNEREHDKTAHHQGQGRQRQPPGAEPTGRLEVQSLADGTEPMDIVKPQARRNHDGNDQQTG